MAHFAKIVNGFVENVLVVANGDCAGGDFPGSEKAGQDFLKSLGLDGDWKQTSYSGSFRFNYAGAGYAFDPSKGTDGAFIPPKPSETAVLDEETCLWVEVVEPSA